MTTKAPNALEILTEVYTDAANNFRAGVALDLNPATRDIMHGNSQEALEPLTIVEKGAIVGMHATRAGVEVVAGTAATVVARTLLRNFKPIF